MQEKNEDELIQMEFMRTKYFVLAGIKIHI